MKEEEKNFEFENNMLTCKEIAGIYCITSKSIISIHSTTRTDADKTKVFMQINKVAFTQFGVPIVKATGKSRVYIRSPNGQYLDVGEDLDEAKSYPIINLRGFRIK